MPCPVIIERDKFDAAQALLVRNRTQAKRNRKHAYLFINGRLRCGQCGCAMTGLTNQQGYAFYRCSRAAHLDVVTPHARRNVQATAVESVVWEAVERLLNNPALITAQVEQRREDTSVQKTDMDRERQHYKRQLAQCDKELKRWEAAISARLLTSLTSRQRRQR